MKNVKPLHLLAAWGVFSWLCLVAVVLIAKEPSNLRIIALVGMLVVILGGIGILIASKLELCKNLLNWLSQ